MGTVGGADLRAVMLQDADEPARPAVAKHELVEKRKLQRRVETSGAITGTKVNEGEGWRLL